MTMISKKLGFWDRTKLDEQTGCLLWQGYCNAQGYGVIHKNYKKHVAHRYSWELVNGAIPDGLFVCHKCDVQKCVNPKHLFLGTQKDNLDDMRSKGRSNDAAKGSSGDKSGRAKITSIDVERIRDMYLFGDRSVTQPVLAGQFNITRHNISAIVRGLTWREL